MIVTIFRSRLKPEMLSEYLVWAKRMAQLAESMPGFISRRHYVAEDGERLTLVMFEDEASQRAWRMHPEHIEAQKKGRNSFYTEYHSMVCTPLRESSHSVSTHVV